VSAQGVARRDEMVWAFAQQLGAPIVMLLSGGYTRASAGVIVDSLTSILQGLKESQLQQQQPSGSARGA
jgi:histone deacetylase 11